MGHYVGEDRGDSMYALGFTDFPGKVFQVGSIFYEPVVKPFVGGEITKVRFALWATVGSSTVHVYKMVGQDTPVEVASEYLENTVVGWNDVTLSTPVEIEEGVNYLLAYEFLQGRNKYMIAVDYDVNPGGAVEDGFVTYGDFENTGTSSWGSMGTSVGNVLIQAVVKGGNFADYDVTLGKIGTYGLYCQRGGEVKFQYSIKNSGNKMPDSYKLQVLLDGQQVEAVFDQPEELTAVMQNFEGTVKMPSDLTVGGHTLSMRVEEINGEVPTDGIEDDMVSVIVNGYGKSYARQKQLVEHFTSSWCTYCPWGYASLEALEELRGDLAWVSIHGNMGPTQIDDYTIDESAYILNFAAYGFPTAAFNRMYIQGDSLGLGIAAEPGSEADFADSCSAVLDMLNEAFYPSFAVLKLSSAYDEASGKVNITVNGERSTEDFDAYVGDVVLTVYLTEDGLISKQLNAGKWIPEFEHNNVLRKIVTQPLGDAVVWNGDTFEAEYSADLDDSWNVENMNVVAFISRPIKMNATTGQFITKMDQAWVVNAHKAAVGSESEMTGITEVGMPDANAYEVARYTIDGIRVNAPVKGLNIVKMSDGRTIKVMVK